MILQPKDTQRLIYLFAIIVLFLIATRLFVFARFFILLAVLITGVGAAIYFILRSLQQGKVKKAYRKSIEGQIESRLDRCTDELSKNTKEMETIRKNIQDLESQKIRSEDISEQNKVETERLLSGFQSEMKLRQTKASFYQTCIDKLKRILHNHRLAKNLLEKENRLKELQEDHYEDLAKMEELRYDVEMDLTYLDTIENLSHELNLSNNYKDAQRLNKELNEMTRGLNEL